MGQPVFAGGWRGWKAAMLLENRDASLDALVTDIHGWTGDKSPDLIRPLAAERAAQGRACPRPERPHDVRELGQPVHVSIFLIRPGRTGRVGVAAWQSRDRGNAYPLAVFSSSSLASSSRETFFSVTLASSTRKSTTFSSKIGARTADTAAGFFE